MPCHRQPVFIALLFLLRKGGAQTLQLRLRHPGPQALEPGSLGTAPSGLNVLLWQRKAMVLSQPHREFFKEQLPWAHILRVLRAAVLVLLPRERAPGGP